MGQGTCHQNMSFNVYFHVSHHLPLQMSFPLGVQVTRGTAPLDLMAITARWACTAGCFLLTSWYSIASALGFCRSNSSEYFTTHSLSSSSRICAIKAGLNLTMVEGYNMLQSWKRLRCTTITKYEIVGPKLIWVNFSLCFPFTFGGFFRSILLLCFCSTFAGSFLFWEDPNPLSAFDRVSISSFSHHWLSCWYPSFSLFYVFCDLCDFLKYIQTYNMCVCVRMCFASSIPSLVCHRTITALSFVCFGSALCWVAVALVVLVVLLLVLHLFLLFLLFLLLSFSLFFLLLFCFSCSWYSSCSCSFSCSCSCCSCSCSCSWWYSPFWWRMLFLWLCCLCQVRFPRKEQKKKEPMR